MTLLDVKQVQKIYHTRFGAMQVEALKDITFSVEKGEYVAIMGESGSGKTTLLNILATLDRPTKGQVLLNQLDIQNIPDKTLAAFRRDHLGFVFQDFNLLETLSVKDNMLLPLVLAKKTVQEMEKKVKPVATLLGIEKLLEKYPYELSNENGQTILMVTHSTLAASRAKRVLFIKDGILYHQLFKGERTDEEMFEAISDTLTVMANRGENHV